MFQKPAGSDGLEVPGSEDCLGFALLSSPLKSSQMHRPPGAIAGVCPRSPGEADGRALRGHSSSCSSSSEPEGPWRTSSYHLLVSVFIWMRPWWRSWDKDTTTPLSVGQGQGEREEGGSSFVPWGGDGRQAAWPQAVLRG